MIPLLIVGNKQEVIEAYIEAYVKEQKVKKELIFRIRPEKKELGIEEVKSVLRMVLVAYPNDRVFVFYQFDKATAEAQNALLKTLEEHTQRNHFLVVAQNEHAVFPTIRSRTKRVLLEKQSGISKNRLGKSLAELDAHPSLRFLSDKEFMPADRDEAIEIIDSVIDHYRKKLAVSPGIAAAILGKTLPLRSLLLNNNLNPQLTLDHLLIFIYEIVTMKKDDSQKRFHSH